MKISTINYNNPKQGYLPLFLSDCLDMLDPVLTFDRLMGGIDLNKYLTDIPEYTTGRLRYNPVNMLKTVLFGFMISSYCSLELPTNYDELKEVCKTFRDNGEYPLVIGAKDSWINIDTWMNIAADINTEKLYSAIEGETPFTDEDLVQSFQIWQNCFTDGVFQDGALGVGMYTDSTDMYQKEGSVPMILNGSWSLGAYMDSDEQSQEVYNGEGANHKIFLMDWNNDGKIAPVEEAVDVSLAINNQSKVKDAAWTFVDWMIHEGADTLVNGQLQYMPARNDMELNVEGLNENGTENLEYCVEQGKNNVGGYREMAYAELKETISNELTELALGDVTPEEAADTIEAASQAQER